MSNTARVDIILLGAGIAGLWTAASLARQGYSVALIESRAIGGIQTVASQGIIHGGTKYALRGRLNESAMAIGEMPAIWRACLAGNGPMDLGRVRILAQHQYLWSTENLVSQLAGFFASKAMRSRMQPISASSRPVPFDISGFHGRLYQLDEPVLDVPSLVRVLAEQLSGRIFLVPPEQLHLDPDSPTTLKCSTKTEQINLQSQRIVLTAGAGNRVLLEQLGHNQPAMQLRPLHMLVLRGKLPPLFAHCLGAQASPRLTITSYPVSDQEQVWYVGGQLAEDGIGLSAAQQVESAKRELRATMPWVDFSHVSWHSFLIERAEYQVEQGRRPDSCYLHSADGVITAWPTKLAFAPRLAEEISGLLRSEGVKPEFSQPELTDQFSGPPMAQPPWEALPT